MPLDELGTAFALLSRAQMRTEAFAAKAAQGADEPSALTFRALAASQSVQSRRFQMFMRGKIGDTAANMAEAFGQGLDELQTELETLLAASVEQGKQGSARVLEQTLKVLDNARSIAPGAKGAAARTWVCGICGHIATEELPERCPVCGAVNSKFEEVQ